MPAAERDPMSRILKPFLRILLVLIAWKSMAGDPGLLAQAPKNQSKNQQEFNETIRAAQQAERLGYILAGAGIALVVVSIPVAIYLDRRKKARRRAELESGEP
jgi:hypothetical protein